VPPEAVQELAPTVAQVRVVDCPTLTVAGVAIRALITGNAGAAATVTVTELGELVPPAPLQVSVYVYVPAVLSGPMRAAILAVGSAPLHESAPLPPVAVQEVVLTVAHVNVVDWPARMVAGTAAKATITGGGGVLPALTVTMTELGTLGPPGPVQVSVYV
jgi:hypothetical protein